MNKKSKKAAADVAFSFIDEALAKGFTLLGFGIAAYLFDKEFLGVLGVATAMQVALTYANVLPENILMRDKKNDHETNKIDAYLQFWVIKFAVLMLATLVASWAFRTDKMPLFTVALIVTGLQYLSTSFTESIKFFYFLEFKNKESLRLSVISNSILVLSMGSIFIFPTREYYLILLSVISIAKIAFWFLVYRHHFNFRFRLPTAAIWPIIKQSLKSYTIYFHIIALCMSFVYDFDLLILQYFQVPLNKIGEYSIVVKMTYINTLLPIIMQRYLVARMRHLSETEIQAQFGKIMLSFTAVGLALMAVFTIGGREFMRIVFNSTDLDFTYPIMLIILGGATIINIFRPYVAYSLSRLPIRKYLFQFVIPVSAFSLISYLVLSKTFGVMGTAWGNVVSYSTYGLGNYFFVKYHRSKNRQIQ